MADCIEDKGEMKMEAPKKHLFTGFLSSGLGYNRIAACGLTSSYLFGHVPDDGKQATPKDLEQKFTTVEKVTCKSCRKTKRFRFRQDLRGTLNS